MSRRVVVLGDVGVRTQFHLGDEAMLEAALVEIGSRVDTRWTVVSAEPGETAQRYGVAAVAGFGFRELGTVDAREARLAQLAAAASGDEPLPANDPALPLLDALGDADAVLIAGGGNLSSSWPHHVYERAALAEVARLLAVPLLVSGQTLGPYLTRRHGELVSAAVTGAQLVGVRERASAGIAARLGVPADRIRCAADDAAFLPGVAVPEVLAAFGLEPGAFVAVTLSSFTGPYLSAELVNPFAELLQHLRVLTGLDVVLVPHLGSPDSVAEADPDDDVHYHRQIAAAAGTGVHEGPLLTAGQALWVTQQAALVVSSRYHPVVFAIAGTVPVLAVTVDDYTDVKITGAAELVGSSDWCVSILGLRSGVVAEAVTELWHSRKAVSDWLGEQVPLLRDRKRQYWDEFAAVVRGEPRREMPPVPAGQDVVAGQDVLPAAGAWTRRNADAVEWIRLFAARQIDWRTEETRDAEAAGRLTAALDAALIGQAELSDVVAVLEESLVVERAGADAARERNAGLVDTVADLTARVDALEAGLTRKTQEKQAETERLAELSDRVEQLSQNLGQANGELHALNRTKLLRWSRPARAGYGRLRRIRPAGDDAL